MNSMSQEPRHRERMPRPKRGLTNFEKLKNSELLTFVGSCLTPLLFMLSAALFPDSLSPAELKPSESIVFMLNGVNNRELSIEKVIEMFKAGPQNLLSSFLNLNLLNLYSYINLEEYNYLLQLQNEDEILCYVEVLITDNVEFRYYINDIGQVNPETFIAYFEEQTNQGRGLSLNLAPVEKFSFPKGFEP